MQRVKQPTLLSVMAMALLCALSPLTAGEKKVAMSLPIATDETITLQKDDVKSLRFRNQKLRGNGATMENSKIGGAVHHRSMEETITTFTHIDKTMRHLNGISLVSVNVTAAESGPDLGPGVGGGDSARTSYLTFVPPDLGPACKVFDVYILIDMYFSSLDVEITFSKEGTGKSVTLYSDQSSNGKKGKKNQQKQQQQTSNCNQTDHLHILFADVASAAIPTDYNACSYPDQVLGGDINIYKPTAIGRRGRINSQSLRKTFAGEPLSGTWILSITDVSPTGNLQGFIETSNTYPLLFFPPCCTFTCGKAYDRFNLCHVPTQQQQKFSPKGSSSSSPQTLCVDNNEYALHYNDPDDYCGTCSAF